MRQDCANFHSQKGEISVTLALVGVGIMLLGIFTGTQGTRKKQNVTPRAIETQAVCSDDDGGEEYGKGGKTISAGVEKMDECKMGDAFNRGDSVIEYYCGTNGVIKSTEKYCREIGCKPKCIGGENEKGYCDCELNNPSWVTPVPTNYPAPTAGQTSGIASVSVLSHNVNSAAFQVDFCSGESPKAGAIAEYWIDGNYAVGSSPVSVFHPSKKCNSIPIRVNFTDTYRAKYCPWTKMTAVVRYNSVEYYRLHFLLPYTNDGICVCIPNGETQDCSRCCLGASCETSPSGTYFCAGPTPTPTVSAQISPSPTVVSDMTPVATFHPSSTPALIPTSAPTKIPTKTTIPISTPTPGLCFWQNDTGPGTNFSIKVTCGQVPLIGTNCSLDNASQGNNVCTQSCAINQTNVSAAPCMCICNPTPTPAPENPVPSVTSTVEITPSVIPSINPTAATSAAPAVTSAAVVSTIPNPSTSLVCPPTVPGFEIIQNIGACSLDQPSGSITADFFAEQGKIFIYQIKETPVSDATAKARPPFETKALTGKSSFAFPGRNITQKETFAYSIKNKYPENPACQDWSKESPAKEITLSCYPAFAVLVNPDLFKQIYSLVTNSNCTDLKVGIRIGHKQNYTLGEEGVLDYEAYQSYTGAESYKFDISDAKLDLDTEYILWVVIINGANADSDNGNVLAGEAQGGRTMAHQSVYVFDPITDNEKVGALCGVIPSVTPGIAPQ